jgi:hypothetical protein
VCVMRDVDEKDESGEYVDEKDEDMRRRSG